MKEWLLEFANTPVGIIVVSVALVIVLVIVIIANTSIGRKSLNTLRNEFSFVKEDSKSYKEYTDKANELFKKEMQEQIKTLVNENAELKNLVSELANCFTYNKKAKDLIAKLGKKNNDVSKISTEEENNPE